MKRLWIVGILVTASLAGGRPVSAQIPHVIHYQGQAADSQGVGLEGPYNLIFRLYPVATGGTVIWEETQPNIPVSGGHFSVLLGQITPLNVDWNQALWLALEVDMTPNVNEELSPRQLMTSVPMALIAERLDGPIATVGNYVGIGVQTPSTLLELANTGSLSWKRFPGDADPAGLLSYRQQYPDALAIFGAGTTGYDRLVHISDGLRVGPSAGEARFIVHPGGNIGINIPWPWSSPPYNILTIQQSSNTDPIADSWTVHPSDSQHKIILGPVVPEGYLAHLKNLPLYRWTRAPLVSEQEAVAALHLPNPTPEQVAAKQQELAEAKAQLPKFSTVRVGMVIDDAAVPPEVLVFNTDGSKGGIDLLAYIGYLHAALQEAATRIEALETQVNQSAL